MPFNPAPVLGLALGLIPSLSGFAQPTVPNDRTGGILVADLTLDAIYLVRDTNGDGIAESATIFFGDGNLSGLSLPTGSVFGIFQSADRTVYFTDGDTDAIYAIRDNNADGDALDPGEARLFFRSGLFNHLNFIMDTPNGITGHGGAIFVANAGVGSAADDAIYRLIDLDGNGNASDMNECSVWFDAFSNVTSSNPFDLCFIGDTAYYADLRGSNPDVIVRLRDDDAGGSVASDEFNTFLTDGDQGAVCDFSCVTDGDNLFTHNLSSTQTIFRLNDLDNSNAIDAAPEATLLWDESALPVGAVLQNSFALAHGPVTPVRTMAISSHGTGAQDAVLLLRDLDGDGDFLQPGETTALITGVAEDGVFPENIRAMWFYAPVCPGDFDRNGIRNVTDIFAFLAAWFAGNPEADLDGVEGLGVPDIFAFLASWFGSCS